VLPTLLTVTPVRERVPDPVSTRAAVVPNRCKVSPAMLSSLPLPLNTPDGDTVTAAVSRI